MTYSNFDLRIDQVGERYRAEIDAPTGQPTVEFSSPFSPSELETFRAQLSPTGRDPRRPERHQFDLAREFGERLFDAVFVGEALGAFRGSLDAAQRDGEGLRIRLRLGRVSELAHLPWEYLYDPGRRQFLAHSRETPIVRYTNRLERIRPVWTTPPLRVLVVIASPVDRPPLDVEREWSMLNDALGDVQRRGLVRLERLDEATLPAVQRRLGNKGDGPHILHFIGHGELRQRGVLLLEDGTGLSNPVDGEQLGAVLLNQDSLRLVVLNACQAGQSALEDPFTGLAQQLAGQGMPAVIAMQSAITDQAAIAFAHAFHESLGLGMPIEEALAVARLAVFSQGHGVEWGTPVLYLRAHDGQIFDVEPLTEEQQRQNQIAALDREAEVAIAQSEWTAAIGKLEALLALDPAHATATERLRKSRIRQGLPVVFKRAREHYDAERWREAWDDFRRVQQVGGDFEGTYALMARARHEIVRALLGPSAPAPPVPPTPADSGQDPLDRDYRQIIEAIKDGSAVPFLGPDANLCCRPPGLEWQQGQFQYLPSTAELATNLAEFCKYPPNEPADLARVAQYVSMVADPGRLYGRLRQLLGGEGLVAEDWYPPGTVHQLLAKLPVLLKTKGYRPRCRLIVTANYDDLLERAFRAVDEPFDLVTYEVDDNQQGAFWHRPWGGTPTQITLPNEHKLPLAERTVIVKIHGAIDWANTERSSYLLTEDQYIGYSSRLASLIPVQLLGELKNARLLFLGYRLRDWSLRVFLHPIWLQRSSRSIRSWAVQLSSDQHEHHYWGSRRVDILDVGLEDFIARLSERLKDLPPSGAMRA